MNQKMEEGEIMERLVEIVKYEADRSERECQNYRNMIIGIIKRAVEIHHITSYLNK